MKTLSAIVLLSAIAAWGQQSAVTNPHATPADVAAGAKMFRGHCGPCHGLKGQGGLGPSLTTGVFYHGTTDADLYRNISDGIPGTAMPDVFFDGTQVWQLVAYVRSISRTAKVEPVPGNARHGEQLFREKGCIGCHLVRGEGGVKGPDLSLIGSQRSPEHFRKAILDPDAQVMPEYWVAKIITKNGESYSGFLMNQDTYTVQILDFARGLKSLARANFKDFGIDKTAVMPSYKDKLSGAELDDLVSYLSSLKRSQGRPQ